jgi:histidinol-phosphatase (PHP family)
LPEYQKLYRNGDIVAFQRTYFEHLALAAETGLFDALAHPDVVKVVEPGEWKPDRLWDTISRSLDRIAATGVALELNTSGRLKRFPEMNPGRLILAEMRQRGIPVVVGADAHTPNRVADYYEEALDTLAEVGYSQVSIFLNRQRHNLDLAAARRSLRL